MADPEGFVYVNRKSRRSKGRMRNTAPFPDLLQRTRDQLVSSGWWDVYRGEQAPFLLGSSRGVGGYSPLDRCKPADILPRIVRASRSIGAHEAFMRWKCLCLGLGQPTASVEARAQLSLLLDLCAELDITHSDTALFDPAFDCADIAALRDLGLHLLSENSKGAYVITTPTLVFMPHCGIELYEHFLRANWSGEALARVILVANDLRVYVESTPAQRLEARSPCVARLAPRLESTLFSESTALPGAFNNTALQVLVRDDDDKHTWSLPPDPVGGSGGFGDDGEVR